MGDKNSAPQAPDMSPLSTAAQNAATEATNNGNEQLQWARDQFAKNSGNADEIIKNALNADNTLNGNAEADRSTYNNVFTPELQAQKQDADNYASEAKKDQMMGAAQAGVGQQFEAARNAAAQNLEGFGIDPTSTRYAALDAGSRMQEAAAKAAAGTQASNNVDATAQNLRQQVIQNSSPLASQSTNEASTGANIGATGVNEGNSTTQTGASTMGTAPQYDAVASNDLTGAANIENQNYGNQLNQYKANQSSSSGIGSALGTAAGIAMHFIPGMAEGGPVQAIPADARQGGAIPASASPSHGAVTDDIPARLNAGEFVIPRDAASWLGEKQLQAMIQKARMERQKTVARPAVGAPPPPQPRPAGAIPMRAA